MKFNKILAAALVTFSGLAFSGCGNGPESSNSVYAKYSVTKYSHYLASGSGYQYSILVSFENKLATVDSITSAKISNTSDSDQTLLSGSDFSFTPLTTARLASLKSTFTLSATEEDDLKTYMTNFREIRITKSLPAGDSRLTFNLKLSDATDVSFDDLITNLRSVSGF